MKQIEAESDFYIECIIYAVVYVEAIYLTQGTWKRNHQQFPFVCVFF